MSIIRRSKSTIQGLRDSLDLLEQKFTELDGVSITAEQKTVLSNITATMAIDLDTVLTEGLLSDNISNLGDDEKIATVKAIREYVLAALQATGPRTTIETLPVVNGHVNLSNRPHMGLSSIFNYGTVRYRNDGMVSYYAVSEVEEEPYRFKIETSGVNFDGRLVDVQYLHYMDARDLNELIGELILEGLVLITNDSVE